MIDYLTAFNASFERLTKKDDGVAFFDQFYENFTASDAEVAMKFANTNLKRQQRMLRESMTEMRDFFSEHYHTPYLDMLAKVHGSRGRDVHPRLYDLWLEALVDTARAMDPGFEDQVELAWRIVMAPGIAFMKFFYER